MNWYECDWKFDQENKIAGFFGQYRFLSNFYPYFFKYDNIIYPTVEHAYQSFKTNIPKERQLIYEASDARMAKKLGKTITCREDWPTVKLSIMENLLRAKFDKSELQKQLLETYPKKLEETNWWGDTFWGVYKGCGKNHLGCLLMKIRNESLLQYNLIK